MENDVNPVPVEPEQGPPPGHRYDHLIPKKESNKKKIVILVTVGILTLAIIACAVYFLLKGSEPTPAAENTTGNSQQQPKTAPIAEDSTPKTFKSTKLGLELTHRTDWQLKEDTDSGEITLTSPETTYTTKDGASKQGAFTLKLRHGATDGQSAAIKATNAILASETIAYAAPLPTQRYYTNITFAGQNDTISMFLVTGATQLKAGESLSNFFINGDTYVIGGGLGGTSPDSLTFDSLPKAAFPENEAYKQALDIVKSLKIS